jgi:hypothetical protein
MEGRTARITKKIRRKRFPIVISVPVRIMEIHIATTAAKIAYAENWDCVEPRKASKKLILIF